MSYVSPEVIKQVKRMDLLTYLKNYEPQELVHFSGNTYTTKAHDSLKISNGKWMWWSQGIGGRSALDYLIKVCNMEFLEAVEAIMGKTAIVPTAYIPKSEPKEKKLLLPRANTDSKQVMEYLMRRGIDADIIQFGIQTGRLYESQYKHNAVFVGMDSKGKPRYASIRGIASDFIGEANGSDKNYSFSIPAESNSRDVHVFESAIDLLSYVTLLKLNDTEFRKYHLLSLAGVYQPKRRLAESKVPAALTRFLKEHPEIDTVILQLDNDRAGRVAAKALQLVLPKDYLVKDKPPPQGKDVNDYLCMKLEIPITVREKRNKER